MIKQRCKVESLHLSGIIELQNLLPKKVTQREDVTIAKK